MRCTLQLIKPTGVRCACADCTFASLGGYGFDDDECDACSSAVNAFNSSIAIVNSTFFHPMPFEGTTYVRAWGGARVLLSGCSFAPTPDHAYTPFQADEGASIYSSDRSNAVRDSRGNEFAPAPISSVPDLPAESNEAFLRRSDAWFLQTQEVRRRSASHCKACTMYPCV